MSVPSKIMERIRKLLNMAKDSSSPNEAAIAARRAEKMMREYQLEEADVLRENLAPADIGVEYEHAGPRVPTWKQVIAVAVAELNDCQVRFAGQDIFKSYAFIGLGLDAILAAELYRYLVGEVQRLANLEDRSRKERNDFCKGAALCLRERINEMIEERRRAFSESKAGTELVLAKQAIIEAEYGRARYGRGAGWEESEAMYAGYEKAKNVNFDEQLKQGESNEQLGN